MKRIKKGNTFTEFGPIPSDWTVSTFGNLLDGFSSGATPYRGNPSFYDGDILWISSGELNYNNITDTLEHISIEAKNRTNLKEHPIGTFLMAITGLEAEGTRGRCGFVGKPATTNQSCMAIYPTNKLSTKYLFYFYRKYANYLAFKYCQGTKQQSYTAKIVKQLPIVCPTDIQEQRAIAEALLDIDSLIQALNKQVEKKKCIKQGAMQELLSGKRRLPGYENKLTTKNIRDIISIRKGQILNSASFRTGNIPVIAGGRSYAGFHDKSNCGSNCITISASGASAGYVSFHMYPIFASDCSVIEPSNSYDIKYIYYQLLLKQEEIYRAQTGGAQPHIHAKDLYPLTILYTENLEEQNAIAQILSDMDKEIELLEKKRDKYINIKSGMMEKLLTGQIRLTSNANKRVNNAKVVKLSTERNHKFEDAVLIAAIVNAFYSDKYPLGRKKVQKLLYLLRRKQESSISQFKKKAAGPYADEIRYKGGEPISKAKKYITVSSSKMGTVFSKGECLDEALSYIEKWGMQSDIQWLSSQFLFTTVNQLEVLATVDMAIVDLEKDEKEISLNSIKELIRSDEEWKAKLTKPYFSDITIQKAIDDSLRMF